ncbi:BACON domain-containing protein [Dokdonella ginsengisoli]|uniref:BACON domain-containing protein n=1 Tax=Dokdonella ginsengisoli TaxID=363846 RepID=A0ABV9QQU7_9GAMM
MKFRVLVSALALGFACAGVRADSSSVATPAPDEAPTQTSAPGLWAAWGGTVEVRWNRDLAGDLGLHVSAPNSALPGLSWRGRDRFELHRGGSLEFHVEHGYFRGFDAGSLTARGGYSIELSNGERIDLSNFRLRRSPDDALILDFVGSDGVAWFYIDRLMYELVDDNRVLSVGAMDMRISKALAERIGRPDVAGWPIADLALTTQVQLSGTGAVPLGSSPHWHGDPAPNGGTYLADLFMQNFQMSYTRCQGCTGPSGTGRVVFTPSSTLKNNVNAGTAQTTIPGQGALGTSTALWTAGIPWNQKFSGNFPPYGNDQHPYLIWNLYRTDAEGRLEQIGRSGVKHAWLTTNGNCLDPSDHDSHILGRGCTDTYGTGNNDTSSDLGPRSEIVPATGVWGRCGSIYDPDCNGSQNSGGNGDYDQRLIVREQQISPSLNTGATYLFESWYLAREDINIYNSMASVTGAPNWSGSQWSPGGGSGYKLGPAVDRWVDPANPGANARSSELINTDGHAKLAVKVKDLGNGSWRYDYVVMNLDYARAVTEGSAPNVRVVSNKGFDRFTVPLPEDAVVSATWFSDGDVDAANDWTVSTSGNQAVWSAPASGNTLDWGTLFSFSLTVNKPPVDSQGDLHVAQAGSPASYALPTLGPSDAAIPDPSATVSPASLDFTVTAGDSADDTLTIGNDGAVGSTLNYSIAEAPTSCGSASDVAWLSVAPVSGSVASGGSSSVTVTANAGALAAGTYSAKLCVATNDPAQASVEVSVSLVVDAPATYTVGGTVSGLGGSGLVLKLNGGNDLPVAANGAFTFPAGLTSGTAYTVTVGTQPSAQTCTVANGSGTIAGSNVTNVSVTCAADTYTLGGSASGLQGGGLVLKNGSTTLAVASDGSFTFPGTLPDGTAYNVSVDTQPTSPAQVCTVANGSGTIHADVTNVAVTCTTDTDTIFENGFDGPLDRR